MPKYQIICKGCNTVHGHAEKPIIDGLSAKCASCGLERIAVEPVPDEVYTQLDFDLFIANKASQQNVHHGFIMNVDDMKGKSQAEIREIFIDRAARTLATILDNPDNLTNLLGGK